MKKLKLISLICAFALLVSCFAVVPAFAETTTKVWETGDGAGTAGVTYQLNNSNFNSFWTTTKGKDIYGTYILVEDITLNTGDASTWKDASNRTGLTVWNTPIGNANSFYGIFDGDGHTISGICMIGNDGGVRAGLFNWVKGTVQNLRLVNSYFECKASSQYYETGSFSARLTGTITNCYSEAILNNNNTTASEHVATGGIAGSAYNGSKIEKCVFAGTILNSIGGTGGILGKNQEGGAQITNCLNLGSISAVSTIVGGIVGRVYNPITITNCMNMSTEPTTTGTPGELGGTANTANVTSSNIVVVEGFRTNQKYTFGNTGLLSSRISVKSIAEVLDSQTKVFSDWTYADGYIPVPTTSPLNVQIGYDYIEKNIDLTQLNMGLSFEGAAIRIKDVSGIRFVTNIDTAMVDALKAIGAEISYGTEITLAQAVTDNFVVDAGYNVLDVTATELFDDSDGTKRIAGTIANIAVENNSRMYASRGYVTVTLNGNTETYCANYSADNSRSIKTVAELALSDATANYTETQLATLRQLAGVSEN